MRAAKVRLVVVQTTTGDSAPFYKSNEVISDTGFPVRNLEGAHVNLPLKDAAVSAVGHAEELTLIHSALVALRRGDASAKLPIQGGAGFSKVADVFNDLVEQNVAMAEELSRLSQMVGKEGKLKRRATLPQARGFWAQSVEN